MDTRAIALALRAAAENLDRAKQLCRSLPAGVVDDDSALTLWLDLPKVINALCDVAGTLDPEGKAGPGEAGWDWGSFDDPGEMVNLAEVDAAVRRAKS